MKNITLYILILFAFVSLAPGKAAIQTYETIKDGDWGDPSIWQNGEVPPTDGSNNTLIINIHHDIVYDPEENTSLPDPMEFKNNFTFTVDDTASLTINSSVKIKNNVAGTIHGEVSVTGDFTVGATGGGNGDIDGDGSLLVEGNVTDPNNIISPTLLNNTRYSLGSGSWNDASNWAYTSGGSQASTPPNSNTKVYIEAGDSIAIPTSAAEAATFELQSGAKLVIGSTASLAINGENTIDGELYLNSGSAGTASLLNAQSLAGNGNAHIQRYVPGVQYNYVSVPVNDATEDFLSIYEPYSYYYDESAGASDWFAAWTPVANYGTIAPAMGLAVYSHTTRFMFSSTIDRLNDGNITVPLAYSGAPAANSSYSWNLIGNPYPSAVDADLFLNDADNTDITGVLYFWDETSEPYQSSDYATYNILGTAGTGGDGNSFDGIIGLGQAFFVQANNAGSVQFKNSMRVADTQGQFFKDSRATPKLKLALISEQNRYNEILLALPNDATQGYDRLYDAAKIRGSDQIAFYSLLEQQEYAIQAVPVPNLQTPQSLKLGFDIATTGNYTLKITQFENFSDKITVWLEDRQTGQSINLNEQTTYHFETQSGQFDQRFVIHFSRPETNPATSAEQLQNIDNHIFVSQNVLYVHLNDQIALPAQVSVFSLAGKKIHSETISQSHSNHTIWAAPGIYIVKLSNWQTVFSQKILIK